MTTLPLSADPKDWPGYCPLHRTGIENCYWSSDHDPMLDCAVCHHDAQHTPNLPCWDACAVCNGSVSDPD